MKSPATDIDLPIAQVITCTEAEGPGRRFALWFQGCPLRCPGCCNPEFLPFQGGQRIPVATMTQWIFQTQQQQAIEGITLLGGEPFAHAFAALALVRQIRKRNLSVMIFSGYTLEQLRQRPEPEVGELLALTDILVDGPYIREQPETQRRWIGSRNQQIHFLSSRYRFDETWLQRNTLEIRMNNGTITVNGFPAAQAAGLWRGWKRKKPLPLIPQDK
ncbi:MAG: radical SAM protein [Gemmata sp.]|nr:radical SAM protein [Gemmata sp.]